MTDLEPLERLRVRAVAARNRLITIRGTELLALCEEIDVQRDVVRQLVDELSFGAEAGATLTITPPEEPAADDVPPVPPEPTLAEPPAAKPKRTRKTKPKPEPVVDPPSEPPAPAEPPAEPPAAKPKRTRKAKAGESA